MLKLILKLGLVWGFILFLLSQYPENYWVWMVGSAMTLFELYRFFRPSSERSNDSGMIHGDIADVNDVSDSGGSDGGDGGGDGGGGE